MVFHMKTYQTEDLEVESVPDGVTIDLYGRYYGPSVRAQIHIPTELVPQLIKCLQEYMEDQYAV